MLLRSAVCAALLVLENVISTHEVENMISKQAVEDNHISSTLRGWHNLSPQSSGSER